MHHGVEFKNITKRYGSDSSTPLAVKGISFEIAKGSLTTILGPSGCGKTTTLRMIAGLESPTSGQIIMNGQDVTTLGPAQRIPRRLITSRGREGCVHLSRRRRGD